MDTSKESLEAVKASKLPVKVAKAMMADKNWCFAHPPQLPPHRLKKKSDYKTDYDQFFSEVENYVLLLS